MSYHLRILREAGAIVEDPALGTRRERWWRRPEERVIAPTHADREGRAITDRMLAMLFARDDDVRRKHAVPNALLPSVTVIFLQLGGVIGGAITVETVYSWPGLGYLTYQALRIPDLPLLEGTFIFFSASVKSVGTWLVGDGRLIRM
jgi:hypothetical protein